MFTHLNNNKGVALLIVMAVVAVVVVVGGTVLHLVSAESKIIYNYGNNVRAYYIAEAAADFAIKEWDQYIEEKYCHPEDGQSLNEHYQLKNVSIDDYIDKIKAIEDPEEEDVLDWLINSYGKDFLQVSFNTEQSGSLANSVNNSEAQILTIKVTGTYDRTEYVYYVKLWYYWDGSTGSYKGLGEPYVAPEPTKPDENTGPFAIITNHLFTSHLRDFTGLFNDAPQIDGNVLIGPDKLSDSFLTYGTDVKGNLYVADDLTIMGGFRGLFVSFDTNITGNLIVHGRTTIRPFIPDIFIYSSRVVIGGHFYHRGGVKGMENADILGAGEPESKIPQLDLPELQSRDWYSKQGYSIINNERDWRKNKNSKLYFNTNHFRLEEDNYFKNNDVTIVAKNSLTIGRDFKGSGVIYAPNGVVFFEPGSEFTGTVICKYLYLFHDVHLQSKEQTVFPD